MIEATTPFVLHHLSQAGGPVLLSALMQRIRLTLSESSLLAHIKDLAEGGHLSITPSATSGQPVVTLKNLDLPKLPVTFKDSPPGPKPKKEKPVRICKLPPRKLIMRKSAEEKRRYTAPKREAILAMIEREPATSAEIANATGLTTMNVCEHMQILVRQGLAQRFGMTRTAHGCRTAIWCGTKLRPSLGDAPVLSPKATSSEHWQRRKALAKQRQEALA